MNALNDDMMTQVRESYAYWNGVNRLYSNWAKKYGLTYHSLYTLYAIFHNTKDCSQKKISEEWLMPKQTVHSILREFEEKQYIYFEVDENDKRNKVIRLTDKGKAHAETILPKLFTIEMKVMERMGNNKRKEMIESNNLFFQLLSEEMEKEI